MTDDKDYDALAAKLAEVEASSQGWIDAAVEQQVRRKRAEARLLEVEAKLADAERVARYETDIAQQALDQIKAEKARANLATPLDDPRVKALAEALRDMTALAIQLGAIYLETRDARAALSALEENK